MIIKVRRENFLEIIINIVLKILTDMKMRQVVEVYSIYHKLKVHHN